MTDEEQALRLAVKASVDAIAAFEAAGASKRKRDEESLEEQKRELNEKHEEADKVRTEADAAAAKVKEDAEAEAAGIRCAAQAERAALDAEKTAMERTHTFASNWIVLNVGGVRFETSLQTLTSVPNTFLGSMFSGRYEAQTNEGAHCIDRNGAHFGHILSYLRDPASFLLSPDLTEAHRAELAVELQFYGLLRHVMPVTPFYAQEQIGVALLRRACVAGTEHALRSAVSQAQELVVKIGSTNPWLTDQCQDVRYAITDRVVNGAPAWAAENAGEFMYRANNRQMWIGDDANCLEGKAWGWVRNTARHPEVLAPTQLPLGKWQSHKDATLGPQFTSAGGTDDKPWVKVPSMRVTAVHGLDDGHPAMAAALLQLAALTANVDA